MAAITAAVVTAAGSAYAANRQGSAAKKAAGAQENAANAANANAQEMYQQSRTDQKPFYEAGTNALSKLAAVNSGDYSEFQDSPDYLYARGQMQQGVERGAAARGSLYSGGTNVDLGNALNGMANQNLGNYTNRLMQLAGIGQGSANSMNGLSSNYSNQFGKNTYNAGQARASSYLAQGATQAGYGNALGAGLSAYAGAGGGLAKPAGKSGWGAFTPNTSTSTGSGWDGSSAFGQWGKGWGG